MMMQKNLDHGSSDYQVPDMPHVPRSARGKRSLRKKVEENQMCAFDVLATVAGQLLEGENSACPGDIVDTMNSSETNKSIKQEQEDIEKLFNAESFDRHSSNMSIPGSEVIFERQISTDSKEHSFVLRPTVTLFGSAFIKPEKEKHDAVAVESIIINKGESGYDISADTDKWQMWNGSSSSEEFHEFMRVKTEVQHQAEHQIIPNVQDENVRETHILEDKLDLDSKPFLVSSDSSAEVPPYRKNSPSGSLSKNEHGIQFVVNKDDGENSSGCTHSSNLSNKASRLHKIGDHKIRKLLASKYCKVPSRTIKDHEFSNYDVESKPVLHRRKMCCTRQRTQRHSFKTRLVERCTELTGVDDLSNLYKKGCMKCEGSDSKETLHRANGTSSSSFGKKSAYKSPDYHVKLRIKSFKIPELLIDIPESATVGLLQQTVMEAVTSFLEGGLHVGILLQGKKVRDENKTLHQAGIFNGNQEDGLDFILEPKYTSNLPLTCNEDPKFIGISDVTEPLARMPLASDNVNRGDTGSASQPVLTSCHESDHDSVHSPADTLIIDKRESNSRALVVVPPANVDALAVVPQRKSRRSEVVQRRTRRPFTVAEVEALVRAVEKLGTGRWRDVKLRAFDNAKHRTYVDLKDKWKTLVHTAKISPQQRRGEPVPQELLDRVLSAHAYWSKQQPKLLVKPSPNVEPLPVLI